MSSKDETVIDDWEEIDDKEVKLDEKEEVDVN